MQSNGVRNVVIMGAGPAGLTAAYELMKHRVPVTVLEQDPYFVGGIARTVVYHGYRFDIGGHRFFSKSQEIEDLWTEILGEELLTCGRLSRIYYQHRYFDYPLKAGNALLNMGPIETIRCISSYVWARVHPVKHPKNLEEWVSNQFGHRLFSIFFKTYTEKVWGMSTQELSADWAAQRIKGLDLGQAIKSALLPQKAKKSDRGTTIKTLIDQFRYPRLGPGQLWERVRDILLEEGQTVAMDRQVVRICHAQRRVTSVQVRTSTGAIEEIEGTHFISTLPIRELVACCDPALPAAVQQAAEQLKYRDFLTVALLVEREQVFPDNWIYIHDPTVKVGRIQNFKNWSADMVADPRNTCLGLEYFCFEGDGLWSSSDEELVELACQELATLGICHPDEIPWGLVVRQPKAYPVYDDTYKQHLAVVRDYLAESLPNLSLVGRNGMHHYNNQDHSMMTALLVARNIATGTHFDPWKVNTDAEYHEEANRDKEDRSGRQVPLPVKPDGRKSSPAPRTRHASSLQMAGWGILLLVCVLFSIKRVIAASHTPTDFCTDYVAAQRVIQGIQPYLPLHCWSAVNPFSPPLQEFDTHPPSSLLLLPIGLLPRDSAILLWGGVCLAAYMITGWLLLRELGWGSLKSLALFMLLSLGWAPFIISENFLNLTQVLTLLLVVAWVISRREYPGWAGSLLALGGLLKIWPAALFAIALLRRQWRKLIVGSLLVLVGAFLALVVLGPGTYAAYLGPVQHNEDYTIASFPNSSLEGVLARPFLSQAPGAAPLVPGLSLGNIVLLTEIAAGLLLGGVLALIWWCGRKLETKAVEGLCQGLLVTVLLVIFPVSWYWTILPVIFPCATTLLALRELQRPPRWWFALLIVGLAQPAGVGWLAILAAVWLSQHQAGGFAALETVLVSLPACGLLLFAGLQAWLLWRGKWNETDQRSQAFPEGMKIEKRYARNLNRLDVSTGGHV